VRRGPPFSFWQTSGASACPACRDSASPGAGDSRCASGRPRGFDRGGGEVGGTLCCPCGTVGRPICFSAPREHFRRTAGWRQREWNFEEIEAYHWGASGVGGDERYVSLAAEALDGWLRWEYDSRLSRKRDSEQEIELFDNREWNQNVRGELEVVRGLQGP
jgi:hypothetical protein